MLLVRGLCWNYFPEIMPIGAYYFGVVCCLEFDLRDLLLGFAVSVVAICWFIMFVFCCCDLLVSTDDVN